MSTKMMTERPKKSKSNEIELYLVERVRVEDLRIGDHLVMSVHKGLTTMSVKQQNLALANFDQTGYEQRYANRCVEIKDISECGSKWRTHIHIGTGCYDTRSMVEIRGAKVAVRG